MKTQVTFEQLKESGQLVRELSAGERVYQMAGRQYRAKYRSIGGFIGTGGWKVELMRPELCAAKNSGQCLRPGAVANIFAQLEKQKAAIEAGQ